MAFKSPPPWNCLELSIGFIALTIWETQTPSVSQSNYPKNCWLSIQDVNKYSKNICPVYVPKISIFKKYWSLDWVFDNPTTANVNNLPSFYIMNQPRNFGISDNWTIWIFCKLWNKEILLYSRSFMMCSTRYTKTRNKAIQESELNFVLWNVIWLYSLTWNKNPETDLHSKNG